MGKVCVQARKKKKKTNFVFVCVCVGVSPPLHPYANRHVKIQAEKRESVAAGVLRSFLKSFSSFVLTRHHLKNARMAAFFVIETIEERANKQTNKQTFLSQKGK